mgnify:CR=1 FL=1
MKERYVVAGLEYIAEDVHLYLALHNGFKTKLQAVKMISENGIDAIIASGLESDVLDRIFSDNNVGTFFKSEK